MVVGSDYDKCRRQEHTGTAFITTSELALRGNTCVNKFSWSSGFVEMNGVNYLTYLEELALVVESCGAVLMLAKVDTYGLSQTITNAVYGNGNEDECF